MLIMGKKDKQNNNIEYLKEFVANNSSVKIAEEYNQENMAIFGANINLKRHIPELKDGLKPVSRRILMTMYLGKLFPPKTAKSATVTGNVLANYHRSGWPSKYI